MDARTISMVVVSLANCAWSFWFGTFSVRIFTSWCIVVPLFSWLLLLLLPFLFLLSYLVFSVTSFTKRRGRRGRRNKWSRRWRGNFSIIWLLIRLLRNCGVLNDRGREKPYWQADCASWKGQCSHLWRTNITSRGERTRIPFKGYSLIGRLHYLNLRSTWEQGCYSV